MYFIKTRVGYLDGAVVRAREKTHIMIPHYVHTCIITKSVFFFKKKVCAYAAEMSTKKAAIYSINISNIHECAAAIYGSHEWAIKRMATH